MNVKKFFLIDNTCDDVRVKHVIVHMKFIWRAVHYNGIPLLKKLPIVIIWLRWNTRNWFL